MKKLQNGYTTPEQSKRLMELGVPADSADCFYINDGYTPNVRDELYERSTCHKFPFSDEGFTPCWSVGRLIELHEILFPQYKNFIIERDDVTLISRMVRYYEICAEQGVLDFSKLEE